MINIIGDMLGTSGYANHVRGLANALNKITDVKISTNLAPGWEHQVNDEELKMLKKEDQFDINLIVTHPMFWRVNCNARRNWVYLVFEGDKVPEWILEECMNDEIERIIVPSEHTKKALWNRYWDGESELYKEYGEKIEHNSDKEFWDKIVLAPHGFNPEIFKEVELTEEEKEQKGETFRFLANKGFRNMEDRGGVQYLVQAFAEEFKPEEKVELVIKINPAYGIPNFPEMFPNINCPPIRIITDNLPLEQINRLYNQCDVFVSPTRAEAFNLPCLEALACGKPVMTTNYGGQTDYINQENGWLLDYKLAPVEHELEYEGVQWAKPNIDDLRAKLREAFEKKDFTKKSNRAKNTAKELTWDNTAKIIKGLE